MEQDEGGGRHSGGGDDRGTRPPQLPWGRPSAHDGGTTVGQDALATHLSELARALQLQDDPHGTLVDVVRAAVDLIPGCDEGSISVVLDRRHVRSEAPSGELPRIVDALQEQTGQGPCLDAVYHQQTVRVADMATEQRWPAFTAGALQAGAAGMLSFQLYVQGDSLGALNLFSRRAGAFDDESEHVGLLFAAHAAVAYAGARAQSELRRSVASRQVIGQAQGMLMERHGLTEDQAFVLLAGASQRANLKLRDLAERLVHRQVPPAGARPASPATSAP